MRISQHNRGLSKFTKGGTPWIEIHKESLLTKKEAREREMFLKSGQGRKWLDETFPAYLSK